MPRSSRHKSHKQHKHSSKEAKEHSDSEEVVNFKDRKDREEVVVRVSKESASSEKRKLSAQSVDGKDVYTPGLPEEHSVSKRRKERSDASGVDRWNGGGEIGRVGSSVGDKETKGESSRIDTEKGLKSKVSVDSKSNKSSRRHESSSEKKEMNPGLIVENQEVKRSSNSSKAESKSKSDKDSSRKEVHQYKESKDKESKDKEHVSERSTKAQDVRRERSDDRGSGKGVVDSEGSRKQSSHLEDRLSKPDVEITDRLMQEDIRIPEIEKETEKRMRRKRDGSDEKGKYVEDVRDLNGRRLSTRDERHKDEKHKEDRYRDKYREDPDRDHRSRDDRGVRDHRSTKDHITDRSGSRHSRDENKLVIENHHKKPKSQNTDRDGSPHLDDRALKYKDYRGKKRSSEEDDRSDVKSRNTKEQRYEVEKKLNSGKVESLADRGRSQSRLADGDSTASGRRKSSPSSGAHFAKDGFRHSSKQSEMKYKDFASEERVRSSVTSSRELPSVSGVPERATESRSADKLKSMGKPIQNDKNHFTESERSPIIDVQVSPQMKEKSHSSTSIDRRHSNRTPVRRNLDIEETVHRTDRSSKDVRDLSGVEDRGSQEWPLEKSTAEEFPQADGDTVSVSSSYNRTNHLPTSSSSVLPPPPPLRTGVDSPSVYNSFEEDNRSKPSNRYKRPGDPNVGRVQGNAWKGLLNWSAPVTNGFIPFQQGPPPGGYHPMMQQYHGPPLYGVRPSMELNPTGVPYHIPDADRYSGHGRSFGWRNRADEACPPHLHGWEGSNGGFGDESHIHGKPDWDQNRHMMTDRGWDTSADLWKGQNNGLTMDFPPASRKEDNQPRGPVDEAWGGKPGPRSRNDRSRSVSRAESIEIKTSDDIPLEQVPIEAPKQVVVEKTPEPSKTLSDNNFCQIYLSKLDISADLTHPELYKQCKSLLDKEGILAGGDVTLSTEKSGKSGQRISNTSSSSPLFPAIKDSVFQRAMILYKKQCEELKAKVPILGTGRKNVSSNDVEMLYSDATIVDQEQKPLPDFMEEEELVPTSTQADVEQPVPASDSEKADPVISFSHEIMEDSVPTSGPESAEELFPDLDQKKRDEAASKHSGEVVEPISTYGSEEPEEHTPPINHMEIKEVDTETAVDVENLEDAEVDPLQHALSTTINSSNNMEDSSMTCDGEGSCSAGIVPNNAFSDDTMCGFLGVTDGSEACEALTPMSIECKLVNLSRIHSPESTH